jgi:hypothetical protein
MFSLQRNQRTRRQNRFCPEAGICGGGRAEGETGGSMYIHVSKCKNDKIKIN